MIQVVDGIGEEFTLFQFECVACAVQFQEGFGCMVDLSQRSFAEYNYIVEVNEDELAFSAGQDHVHRTLKVPAAVQSPYDISSK